MNGGLVVLVFLILALLGGLGYYVLVVIPAAEEQAEESQEEEDAPLTPDRTLGTYTRFPNETLNWGKVPAQADGAGGYKYLGMFKTVDECEKAAADSRSVAYTWQDPKIGPPYGGNCHSAPVTAQRVRQQNLISGFLSSIASTVADAVDPPASYERFDNETMVSGKLNPGRDGQPGYKFLGVANSREDCEALAARSNPISEAYTWHNGTNGSYAYNCHSAPRNAERKGQNGLFSGLLRR